MKIKITTQAGYSSQAFSWGCPMCSEIIHPNLDLNWVVRQVETHLVEWHHARCIVDVEVVPVDVRTEEVYSTEVFVVTPDRDGGMDVSLVASQDAEQWVADYAANEWPDVIYTLVSIKTH